MKVIHSVTNSKFLPLFSLYVFPKKGNARLSACINLDNSEFPYMVMSGFGYCS